MNNSSSMQNKKQTSPEALLGAILTAGGAAHAALAEEIPCYETGDVWDPSVKGW